MKWASYRLLRLLGWQFHGKVPSLPKMVIVGAPHTSNWDFIAFLAALHAYDFRARFIGKHTLFRWPFGYLFRALGGLPVDRSRAGGIVKQVTDVFDASEEMILVLAPEGTREAAPFWKSGFLKIANAARVPLVFAAIDGPSRVVALSEPFPFGGDVVSVMDEARRFYSGKLGIRPAGGGPVRVEEEARQS